jgi:hypothetical protein
MDMHSSVDVVFRANDGGSDTHHNIIQNCHLHDPTGPGHRRGHVLGCHSGDCSFRDNIIRHNYVHSSFASGISQGDCIEIKRGSYNNIVADNVIHDCAYPGVFVYGKPGAPPNKVLRNVISNCGDHCIQVTSDAVIVGNVIANCGSSGIAVQSNAGTPENVLIAHNTIYDDSPISFSGTVGSHQLHGR